MNSHQILKVAFPILFVLLNIPLLANAVEAEREKTLCNAGEEAYFTCELEGTNKIVSVCAARNVSLRKGYVQYRYGTQKKIEFKYPKDIWSKQNTMSIIDVSRSAFGLGTHLKFTSGGYRYVVSNALIPGEVYVTKNGKIVFDKVCRGGIYVPFSDNLIYGIPHGMLEKIDDLDGHLVIPPPNKRE